MFDKRLVKKIDKLIMEKFPMIYDYDFKGTVFLQSGAIRNIIMDIPIKDLDFVILLQSECQIHDFIKKYNLNYKINVLGGYKLFMNNTIIDIFSVNDLFESAVYDADMLLYDIKNHNFVVCGGVNVIKTRAITQINMGTKINYANNKRIKKIINFVKFATKNNKRVVVKQNKLVWLFRSIIKKIMLRIFKIKNK